MIPFNRPFYTGEEDRYVAMALRSGDLCGNGPFSRQCESWLERTLSARRALLTASCTQALEMAALMLDLQCGDEVIMPSYTFPSTANAFVMHGARLVFVDVNPETMNIDPEQVRSAITDRTRAIVPVHYAGVSCDMDAIMAVANRHGLVVVEDAAQAFMSQYCGRFAGTTGHMGAISFHQSKNITSGGEGGVLLVNDERFALRADVVREKGTDRSRFLKGEVARYSWVSSGGSYLMSEVQAACLWSQLQQADNVIRLRRDLWNFYHDKLERLVNGDDLLLPRVPGDCDHNGHIYFVRAVDQRRRDRLEQFLARRGIQAVTHYEPLHSAVAGQRYGVFHGEDRYTTRESSRLLRLPLWAGLTQWQQHEVVDSISDFFRHALSA